MSELLDLAGIFVFALSGALMGVRKRLDVVGMGVLAEMTALGGGVVRDLILNVRPAAFQSLGYVLVPLVATVIVFFFHPHVARVMPAILVLDAAGLGLFCAVGTEKAMEYGLSPCTPPSSGSPRRWAAACCATCWPGRSPPCCTTGSSTRCRPCWGRR
ncbi:trimeric intracellular cation channel family protein [Nonomuraea antimicrobica]